MKKKWGIVALFILLGFSIIACDKSSEAVTETTVISTSESFDSALLYTAMKNLWGSNLSDQKVSEMIDFYQEYTGITDERLMYEDVESFSELMVSFYLVDSLEDMQSWWNNVKESDISENDFASILSMILIYVESAYLSTISIDALEDQYDSITENIHHITDNITYYQSLSDSLDTSFYNYAQSLTQYQEETALYYEALKSQIEVNGSLVMYPILNGDVDVSTTEDLKSELNLYYLYSYTDPNSAASIHYENFMEYLNYYQRIDSPYYDYLVLFQESLELEYVTVPNASAQIETLTDNFGEEIESMVDFYIQQYEQINVYLLSSREYQYSLYLEETDIMHQIETYERLLAYESLFQTAEFQNKLELFFQSVYDGVDVMVNQISRPSFTTLFYGLNGVFGDGATDEDILDCVLALSEAVEIFSSTLDDTKLSELSSFVNDLISTYFYMDGTELDSEWMISESSLQFFLHFDQIVTELTEAADQSTLEDIENILLLLNNDFNDESGIIYFAKTVDSYIVEKQLDGIFFIHFFFDIFNSRGYYDDWATEGIEEYLLSIDSQYDELITYMHIIADYDTENLSAEELGIIEEGQTALISLFEKLLGSYLFAE